jgi:thymidylate synthase
MKIKEMSPYIFSIENPYKRIVTIPERALSMKYLVGELSFYLSGSDDLSFISYYSKFWNKVSDDGVKVNSAYGKRIFFDMTRGSTQFKYCIDQLIKDPDTRKAVMTIYAPSDSVDGSKDNPCTLSIQFLLRQNKLNCIVNMRSNDVWFGTPYDVAFFAFVQERLLVAYNARSALTAEMGSYTHFVGSLHAYEKDWESVRKCAYSAGDGVGLDEMPRISSAFDMELWLYLDWEEARRTGKDTHIEQDMLTDPVLLWMMDVLSEGA